jgi:hypothetical protein
MGLARHQGAERAVVAQHPGEGGRRKPAPAAMTAADRAGDTSGQPQDAEASQRTAGPA